MMPDLAFLPVSDALVAPLSRMQVAPQKAHLIAPVPVWLAQAALSPAAATYGVFDGDTPVGLVSLLDPRSDPDDEDKPVPDCIYVWRLMVDGSAEGRGIGRAIMTFVQGYAALVGLNGVTLTTMDKHDHNALPFYKRLGFAPTGRRLHDEIELIWRAP